MFHRIALLGALALLAFAQPAAAQKADLIDLTDPAVVATALQRAGYKAEVKLSEKSGRPYIASEANGSPFTIQFYGCKEGKKCTSMQFFTWWKKDKYFSVAIANEWNSKMRFVHAVLDSDGDIDQYMDITTVGPVSYEFFADTVDWWVQMDREFTKFMREKSGAK